jgi:hypothetical protein
VDDVPADGFVVVFWESVRRRDLQKLKKKKKSEFILNL